ncbi:MAG: hypothetical protein ABGZ17_01930 [Planctomycetaceae bacterium]
MDKIKPLLVHKFWFILGIAIVVGVFGWWWDTRAISSQIETRTEAIRSAVKNSNINESVPNDNWAAALKDVNNTQNQSVVSAEEFLFGIQSNQMTWPISVGVLMKDVPYRGKFVNTKPLDRYRNVYQMELNRVWKLADPYDPLKESGRVQLSQSILPQVERNLWQSRAPTWKEMWDAQEDLWLVEDILTSVANLNKDYRTIRESPVRVIEQLLLKGGARSANGEPTTGGGGLEGEDGGEESAMKGGGGGFMSAMRGAMDGGGGGNQNTSASVTFNPTEVFGSDSGTDAGAEGEGGGASMQQESSGGEGDAMKAAMGAMGGGGMGGQSSKNAKRYVDNDESRPFKTRGFYLQVVMKHDQLPDLIAELTNSKWPVEILRVQQEDLHKDNIQGSDGGAGASGIGGRGLSMMRSSPAAAGPPSGLGAPSAASSFGGGDPAGLSGLSSPSGGFGQSVAQLGAGGDGDTATQQTGGDQSTPTLSAAQQDRGLARVSIAGLMTLYSPPPAPDASEMASAADGIDASAEGTAAQQPNDDTTPPVNEGTEPPSDSEDAPTTTSTSEDGAPQPTNPAATATTAPEPQSSVPSDAPSESPANETEESPKTQQPAAGEKSPPADKQPAATGTEPDAPPTGGTSK